MAEQVGLSERSQKWPREGSRVRHWHAGWGTVLRLSGATAWVRWDRGGKGSAWIRDLEAA